jgi:hypothetical protein
MASNLRRFRAAYRNRTDDLRITRVSPCVAHGLKARANFMFAGGCWCRSLVVDGRSGASRGHASVMRRPGSRWSGAVGRPSAFQAGHISGRHGWCESYALSPVAGACRWLLLLLSPLLSGPGQDALPGCPGSSPNDCPHRPGDGPVSWPGSLPGPWFLARVLPEARCQGWPKVISEGNAKRP